jgi:hypothetical protein
MKHIMALTLSNMPTRISFPDVLDYLSISALPQASSPGIKRPGRKHEYALPSTVTHPVPHIPSRRAQGLYCSLPYQPMATAIVHRL